MAHSRPVARSETIPESHAWWFPYHLWNLDAPLVAVIWQRALAADFHVRLAASSSLALAGTVWFVYAADRLLDLRNPTRQRRTARHEYHRRYRKQFVTISAAVFASDVLLSRLLPGPVFHAGLLMAVVVAAYFGAVHLLFFRLSKRLPKEIVAGILFASGTALAPWTESNRSFWFFLPASLFALICILNCVAIEIWEEARNPQGSPGLAGRLQPHPATRWLADHLETLLWAAAAASAILLFTLGPQICYCALLVTALAFISLSRGREHLHSDLLRVLADLPLLSPLLFLGFTR